VLRLPAKSGPPQAMTIDPEDLDAALARDQAAAKALASATARRQEEINFRAVERAEDEGMIARPL
jgi:uncharacterized protein YdeI (YjbR/CyaY-like superfamily)